jgi:hypothetical protein
MYLYVFSTVQEETQTRVVTLRLGTERTENVLNSHVPRSPVDQEP